MRPLLRYHARARAGSGQATWRCCSARLADRSRAVTITPMTVICRIDRLERVVRGREVRTERRCRGDLPGGVELRAPEGRLVRLVADDESLHFGIDRREDAHVGREQGRRRRPPRSRAAGTGGRRARRGAPRPAPPRSARSSSGLSWMTIAWLGTKRTPMTVCPEAETGHFHIERRSAVVGELPRVVVGAHHGLGKRSTTGAQRRTVAVARITSQSPKRGLTARSELRA